ncbi:hypothetical protein [Prevotella intermedia]|uniref:Uncharacterized protein n=1 Tax=Prevotella intermedia TaxID=28131 RepID=A0A2G9ICX3_PREIN|nr:hypothetical protein [Prevotella intermedia]PIN27593.1 hypothetical protein CUC04_09530 [Prevotella intermedia]
MIYKVADLVREVRIAIDKNNSSAPLAALIDDVDTLSIGKLIESKIEDATRAVTVNAPRHLLDSGKGFSTAVAWSSSKTKHWGFTQLPEDFLRLVTFQMSDWSYPVVEAITETDPIYKQQNSRFAGIGGNPQRPVVAIVQHPIGLILEFYSCTSNDVAVKIARYIPIPRVENERIGISEKLVDSVVYYCAYLVLTSLSEVEQAKVMFAIYKNLSELK